MATLKQLAQMLWCLILAAAVAVAVSAVVFFGFEFFR